MFSVKFYLSKKSGIAEKTINNFIKYVKSTFLEKSKIVKNGDTTEISTGKVAILDCPHIELVVKKVIPIDEDILNDRAKLDKVICELKDFCDNANKIEGFSYEHLIRRISHEDKT